MIAFRRFTAFGSTVDARHSNGATQKPAPLKRRRFFILFLIFVISVGMLYIAKRYLRVDIFPTRHMLFFRDHDAEINFYGQREHLFELPVERRKRKALFNELMRRAQNGEQIGWVGRPRHVKATYEDGALYWNGSVHTVVLLPDGPARIVIYAKGSPADGVYPQMIVEIDKKEVGRVAVDSRDWQAYTFDVKTGSGFTVLSATFPNDKNNERKREDRNLYVGTVRVEPCTAIQGRAD